jgi:anaerobic selenocysteine-containing dehydrogenase
MGHWEGAWSEARFSSARNANMGHFVARHGFVSPHRSHTGANADDWYKCTPGTEAQVALAIAKLVADNKHATRHR